MARLRKEDEGERRTAGLRVQLTPTERAELDARAERSGYRLSDFSRVVLLSDLKAPAPSARDPGAIRALVVAIDRVGTNVNQMTHIANELHDLPSRKALDEVAERIKATLAKVLAL